MATTGATDYEINDPPSDGISRVRFSPQSSNLLVASSWDKTVRLWDVKGNEAKAKYMHDAPVLDCVPINDKMTYSGGLDRKVIEFDFNTQTLKQLGSHEDAVRCVEYCAESGYIISGGWDRQIKLFDPKSDKAEIGSQKQLPGKVFSMSVEKNILVVAMSERKINIYDLRKFDTPLDSRDSSLQYQTRSVKVFPSADSYVLGSIEGRVAVDFIDKSPDVQAKKYAFRCHRRVNPEDGVDLVYPVHCLAFHPTYHTFATGGGDGAVNVWDGKNKKRIRQFPRYSSSISSLDFSKCGSMLAIASSYAYEEGEKDHEPDSIYIKMLSDTDVHPKT